MNKKIKIIELLQDFADEKEIVMPKYIRYWDRIEHKDEVMLVCKANIINKLDDCKIDLNDEVEILEDNTEEIEELELIGTNFMDMDKNQLKDEINKNRISINKLRQEVFELRKDKNNE